MMTDLSIPAVSFPNPVSRAGDGNSEKDGPALMRACRDMESLFLYHLIKEMRAAIPAPESGLMKSVHLSLADLNLAEDLAKKGGIGLASVLFEQAGKNL